jgi:hypothetical protein
MQKEMLFYYCNPTDDMQITIYTQKPGHNCWSWEAIYKGGSAFASRRVGGNKCSGLELVAVSRAVELNDFAVGNSITELTTQALLRIGNTDAYHSQNMFLEETRRKSIPSQEKNIVAITQLDTTTTSN